MKRLLYIEWIKLWNHKPSKIILIFYFFFLLFIALIAAIKIDIGAIHIQIADQGIFNFPYIWHFNAYIAALLKIFLAVVVVSLIANEYSFNTIKQNLIDGLSKKEFLASKFLMVLALSVLSTLFVVLLSSILGGIYSTYTEFAIITTDLSFIVAYFLKLVAFFTFCLMIAIMVKRSAFALGFLFIWNVLEKIAFGLLTFKFFPKSPIAAQIMGFFPLESMSNLIQQPFTRLSIIKAVQKQVTGVPPELNQPNLWLHFGIVIVWTGLFLVISYQILKKRDL